MSEWQPIETAPKDGTIIDLWVVELDCDDSGFRFADAYWLEGAWVDDFEEVDEAACRITHWMPRPEPPK